LLSYGFKIGFFLVLSLQENKIFLGPKLYAEFLGII
jgi:hypothetical protein